MATTTTPVTLKQLRAACKKLGITRETANRDLDILLAEALDQDDPLAWIELYAPAPSDAAALSDPPPADPADAEPVAEPAAESPPPLHLAEHRVTLPLVRLHQQQPPGYLNRHVEINRLTLGQALGLHGLWHWCRRLGHTTADGKPIATKAAAVRWLLEQLVTYLDD